MVRNQRARLFGAMIEAVARRGFQDTTVAYVVALAGVSRRAFYELFSSKEDCFLAAYDSIAARARRVMIEAWTAEQGWANRRHASCRALLEEISDRPKAARLVLVDSLGIGSSVREHMDLAGRGFERLVSAAFNSAPAGPPLPRLASQAIVSGVRQVLFRRMREERDAELRGLADEILDWSESYRSPRWSRLATGAPADPPAIRTAPTAFISAAGNGVRALVSLLYLTLEGGYAELTEPQIAQFAGISPEAMRGQLVSKDAAFGALLDAILEEAMAAVRLGGGGARWPDSVSLGMSAFLAYLASHPPLARAAFVEPFAAGPEIVDRVTRLTDELTRVITGDGPPPRHGPLIAQEAIAGALWGIIHRRVLSDQLERLAHMTDQLSFLVLAPYIGAEAASKAIERTRQSRSGR